MPAELSNNIASEAQQLRTSIASKTPWTGRLLMLMLNYIPFFHALLTIGCFFVPQLTLSWRIAAVVMMLYLVPPLFTRLVLFAAPIRTGSITVGSREFFAWWTSFQMQVLFCRFPALEEVLRTIPGLYSTWLRLWGSRIGRFTYWSAGTLITDRSFLRIGDDVVFGAGVRLNAHVITKTDAGELQLLLAPITIGDRAVIGGYSLLTAGTEISADEGTRAFLISPPFSVWKNGKRARDVGVADNE